MRILGAIVCTFLAGFLGTGILGNLLNWPDAGAVCAICVMGAFILYTCLENKNPQSEEDEKVEISEKTEQE